MVSLALATMAASSSSVMSMARLSPYGRLGFCAGAFPPGGHDALISLLNEPCLAFATIAASSSSLMSMARLNVPVSVVENVGALLTWASERSMSDNGQKAYILNALAIVRLWGQSGTLTPRCLPISIYEYTA